MRLHRYIKEARSIFGPPTPHHHLGKCLSAQRLCCLKNGLSPFIFLFIAAIASPAHAAIVTWDGGGGDTNWNTCANWSLDTCPTAADIATFNATSVKNATITADPNVDGIDIQAGYTGVISQNAGVTITVGATNFVQASGTFTGGNSAIQTTDLIISGGSFTATSGTMTVGDDFIISGGTFSHNGGTVTFTGGGNAAFTFDVVPTLNHVIFNRTNRIDITGTSPTLDIDGNFTLTSATDIDGGTISLAGNITTSDTLVTGNSAFTIDGGNTQTVDGSGTNAALPNLTINKSGGSLTFLNDVSINADFTYTAGSVDTTTNNVTIQFGLTGSNANTLINSNALQFNHVTFNKTNNLDVSGTMDINGNLTINSATNLRAQSPGDRVTLAGNLISSDATIDGDLDIEFDGTTDQTINIGSNDLPNGLLTVNKTSGVVQLLSNLDLSLNGNLTQDVTITQGTLDLNGFNLTVPDLLTVGATGTFQLQGNETVLSTTQTLSTGSTVIYDGAVTVTGLAMGDNYHHLIFNNATTGNWTLDAPLTVSGDLTITDGIVNTNNASSFTVNVTGHYTQNGGQFEANASTLTVGGNFSGDVAIDETDYNSASIVLTGTGSLALNNLSTFWANGFNNLTVGQSGNITTFDQALTVNNILTVGSGEFTTTGTGRVHLTAAGNILSLDPNATISIQALKFHGSGVVQNLPALAAGYDTSIALSGIDTIVTQTGNVTINGGNSLRIIGDTLADRAGTFNTANFDLNIGGNIEIGAGADTALKRLDAGSSAITVGGDIIIADVTGGTAQADFIPGTSTVTLNGNTTQNITSRGSAFNNLTITNASNVVTFADALSTTNLTAITPNTQLAFADAITHTVSGTLNLNGQAASTEVALTSTTPGVQFSLDVGITNPQNVSYISVKDSDVLGSNITALNSINAGGNDDIPIGTSAQWVFVDSFTWTGATVGNNNWNDPGNWYGLSVPGVNDTAIFSPLYNIDSNINVAINVQGIQIDSGYSGIITQQTGNTITLGSSGYSQAAGTFTGDNAAININGNFTQSGGAFTSTSNTLTIANDITITGGSFAHNSGTLISGNSSSDRTINSGSTVFNNVEINTGGRRLDVTGTLDIDGNLTITDARGISNGISNDGVIAVAGNVTTTNATDISDGTILFDGTGDQTLSVTNGSGGSGALPGISINKGSGTLFIRDTINFNNNFTYTAGIVDPGTSTIGIGYMGTNATTDIIISAGNMLFNNVSIDHNNWIQITGSMDINGDLNIVNAGNLSAGEMSVAGNVTTIDSTISGFMDILFDGTTDQTLSASGGTGAIPALAINKTSGTLFIQDTIYIDSNLTYTAGNVDSGTSTVGFGYQGNNATGQINTGGIVFNNVGISKNNWMRIPDGLDVNGNLSIDMAADIRDGTITVAGNLSTNDALVTGNGAIMLDGTLDQTIDGGSGDFPDGLFTINKAGGKATLLSIMTLNGTGQDLTISQGALDLNGFNLIVPDTITTEANGTLQLEGDEAVSASSLVFNPGSTALYDGTNLQGSPYTIKDWVYQNLTINGSGGVFNLGADESVAQNLAITTGTLDLSGYNFNVTGTMSNDGTFRLQGGELLTGTMDSDSGLVEYYGSASYSSLAAGNSYYHLTFNNASASWTHTGVLDVNGNLTLTNGTLNSSGNNITLAGDWNKAAGSTYTSGANTVLLDGSNQSIQGSSTFNNLTKNVTTPDTLTFQNGQTQTVTGALDLQGSAGNLLSLRSDTGGNQWGLVAPASTTVSYVVVSDSDNSTGTTIDATALPGNIDSGNNLNWSFGATDPFTWTNNNGTGDNNWDTATNWSGGAVPGPTDTALFTGAFDYPANINISPSVAGIQIVSGYTSTITQLAGNTITLGVGGYSQASGTFSGGDSTIDVNGSFSLTGGSFTSTSATMDIANDFTVGSSATFTHSSGAIQFTNGNNRVVDVGNASFNNVELNMSGGSMDIAGTFDVNGNLTLTGVNNIENGTISVAGDVTTTDPQIRGSGKILFNGVNQTLMCDGLVPGCRGAIPAIEINSTGTLTIDDTIELGGSAGWTLTAGAVNTTANSAIIVFDGAVSRSITDSSTIFNQVQLEMSGGVLTVNGTMDVDGPFIISGVNNIENGVIAVSGDVTTTDAGVGGSGRILFDGVNQTLHCDGLVPGCTGAIPGIEVNNTGVLTIDDTIEIDGSSGWTLTAGTIDATTNSTNIVFDNPANRVINDSSTVFNNVELNMNGGSVTVTGSMDINGDFTITGVNNIDTGTITVAGNLTSTDSVVAGTAAITLDGGNAQSIDVGTGDLPAGTLTINKLSNTATLISDLALNNTGQDLVITQNSLDLNGNTVTVNDSITIAAAGTLLGQSSTINIGGNWSNNGTFTAATSTVILNGTGTQSITSGGSAFNNLTVTNSTDVVTFADALSTTNLTAITPSTQLAFADAITHTVSGTLNLNGQATSTEVVLTSTAPGVQFSLDVGATNPQTVSYVSVRDSDALGSDITALNSVNVSNNDDTPTGAPPQWVFGSALIVTNTNDSGAGSLRQAMLDAATNDTIAFSTAIFPTSTPATITLASALPNITADNITIDGSFAGVVVNGAGSYTCFTITSSGNTIKGLTIENCINGVLILSGTGNTIGGNYTIGSAPHGEGNIIINNSSDGVEVHSNSNTISGNYLGNDGNTAQANGQGIWLRSGASFNIIGGSTINDRNIISGNTGAGIVISDSTSTGNGISGNYIGTNPDGTSALANGSYGIYLYGDTYSNIIGGNSAARRNIISGNGSDGIQLTGSNSNTIIGNYIGIDSSGNAAIANGSEGIAVGSTSASNIIGTANPGEGNVISGNTTSGIWLYSTASSTAIRGNYIGTNGNATAIIGNLQNGIAITNDATNNTIGGTVSGEENVLSGNIRDGIYFTSSGNLTVSGNYIGTNATAATLPNSQYGIRISDGTNSGTLNLTSGNVIADNGLDAIFLNNNLSLSISGSNDINDTIALYGGVLNLGSATINLSSNWLGAGTTVNPGSSTVILDGITAQQVTSSGEAFASITITNSSAAVTFNDALTTNNLTAVTASSDLVFAASLTHTVNGTLNIYGQASGNEVRLSSTSPGTQFDLDVGPSNPQIVSFVSVQDSNALGSNITAFNSINATGNDDTPLGSPPQWVFSNALFVTNTLDDLNPGSLRYALSVALANETVLFDTNLFLPGSPQTISISSTLTMTTGSVTINASNAGVILDGGTLATGGDCLTINSSNNSIMGLRIQNCTDDGILISSGTGNTIGGDNTSGSGPSGEGNIVVSNGGDGIEVNADANLFYGNFIGTDGTLALGNAGDGINLFGDSNTIGGTGAGQRNIISGNSASGLVLNGAASSIIQNNYIGVNVNGTASLGNSSEGISLINGSSLNTVGGTTPATRNIISGNGGSGIRLDGSTTTNNIILGNYIGTDISGSANLGNGMGIQILNDSTSNIIGGTAANSGNTISWNNGDGINYNSTGTNSLLGNYIGTNASSASMPNTGDGIDINNGTVSLGNSSESQSNVIGPNSNNGIFLRAPGTLNLGGIVDINGDLNLLGTLNMNDATLLLSGNWTNASATVNAGTSTLTLDGTNQAITGSSTFYNITKSATAADSLTIQAGTLQTINGLATLQGSGAGSRLALRSNTTGVRFNIAFNGTTSFDFLDVQDSDASPSSVTKPLYPANSIDSGNTLDWFSAAPTAVTSVIAEISPNSAITGSASNPFSFYILPTIGGTDTGINQTVITAPAGYSNIVITDVMVNNALLTAGAGCPTVGSGEYCAVISGQDMTINFGTAITTTLTPIQVDFTTDVPATIATTTFNFIVDDTTTFTAGQTGTAGDADGNATNSNSLDVNVISAGDVVTSVVAEITPDTAVSNSATTPFRFYLLPTIEGSDTGFNRTIITMPTGYTSLNVTATLVNGAPLTAGAACPTVSPGEYCTTISGQDVIVDFGSAITTTLTPIRIDLTSDTPNTTGITTITYAVDDSTTGAIPPLTGIAGDADGNSTNSNSLDILLLSVDASLSTVTALPEIIVADGSSTAEIVVTLLDSNGNPVSGKTVQINSDRGVTDNIIQPSGVTDANGIARGTISSSTLGESTITVINTTDGITLQATPTVYFTQGLALTLTKVANKQDVTVGDLVTYTIEVKNTTNTDIQQVRLEDVIPDNFKYRAGSTLLNGAPASDPAGNRTLTFTLGTVPALVDTNGNGEADPGEIGYITYDYQLIVGSGAMPGKYTNTAVAKDVCDRCAVSSDVTASVSVVLDPLFDLGTIIGKVFHDKNGDNWQDENEPGIAGAMVVLDEGTYALTDTHGRYHFPAVTPGERLLKINLATLPSGTTLSTNETQVVSVTPGLLVKANFGAIQNIVIKEIGETGERGLLVSVTETPKDISLIGNAEIQNIIVNGSQVRLPQADVRLYVDGIPSEALNFSGDKLEHPAIFQIDVSQIEEVRSWALKVMTPDGETVRDFDGNSTPPETIVWDGYDNDNSQVTGGNLYHYQLTIDFQDGSHATSARRLIGIDHKSVIELNLSGGSFKAGDFSLNENAIAMLKDAAETLRRFPREQVVIEGHADSTGDNTVNLNLSQKRAEAAHAYLVGVEGISPMRLKLRWYGEARPIAPNDTDKGRLLNRRVTMKGLVSDITRADRRNRFNRTASASINGRPVKLDRLGRFFLTIKEKNIFIEMSDRYGRSTSTNLSSPQFSIAQPADEMLIPYFSENDSAAEDNPTPYTHQLIGTTTPGSLIQIGKDKIAASGDGTFSYPLPLSHGKQSQQVVIYDPQGFTYITELQIDVRPFNDHNVPVYLEDPVPELKLNLPPTGFAVKEGDYTLSGSTAPDNMVLINNQVVRTEPDGKFTHTVQLKQGENPVHVKTVDQRGYVGAIDHTIGAGESQLFFMAFADGKFSQLKTSGYIQGSGQESASELYSEGRIAFYLKGKIKGKYLITAALDTGQGEMNSLFSDLDDDGSRTLLRNLDPDYYYPVYGDNSTVVYDTQSQGKFYLAVDSETIHGVVGNYKLDLSDNELAAYRRTLYGGLFEYQSLSRTAFGQHDTVVRLFSAQTRQSNVRDELRATGGSLYYLSQRNIIEGSEQVFIVVKDKNTGLTLSRQLQQQNIDYSIKYIGGRLLFTRPVASTQQDSNIINDALLAGNPVYIEVDYEYYVAAFEKSASGLHARQQIGDNFAIGATYVDDSLAAGRYELQGINSEVRIMKNSRITAEIAESRGSEGEVFSSNDGGLQFSPIASNEQAGQATKIAAEIDIGEFSGKPNRLMAGAYVKELDPGFQANGNSSDQGKQKRGADLMVRITDKNTLKLKHDQAQSTAVTPAGSVDSSQQSTAQWQYKAEQWSLVGEYRDQQAEDSSGTKLTNNSIAATKLTGQLTDQLAVSITHQTTLEGVANDQNSVGLEYRLTENLHLEGRATGGDKGDAGEARISYRTDKASVYITERLNDNQSGKTTSTIIGGETSTATVAGADSGKVYSEYQWDNGDQGDKSLSLVGVEQQWKIEDGWKFNISSEYSDINAASGITSRTTIATGISYMNNGTKISSRNEIRNDRGNERKQQYLTSNTIEYSLNPDYIVLAKYRYSITKNLTKGVNDARFEEQSIGLAYRPTRNDWFNALARYTRLSDMSPLNLGSTSVVTSRMDVLSVEWAYQITKKLEWSEKQALRLKRERTDKYADTETQTQLSIHRLNYTLPWQLRLGAEYRTLRQKEANDKRSGWLSEITWETNSNLRLGVGYNFTDFSDNEFSANNYSTKGWFIRIQGKY